MEFYLQRNSKVFVSVVLFKNKEKLISKMIESLLQSRLEVKLILIDNSPDNRLQKIELLNKDIEYIFLGRNLGYGAAHNIALKKSIDKDVQYHLVLNPDVYFKENVLNDLYVYMENNLDVGNIMPLTRYPDKKNQFLAKLLPSPIDLFARRFLGFTRWAKNRDFIYELRFANCSKIINAPNLSGCFMFLRVSVIIKVGLFDENFFMYMEDVDLNRRIHKKYKTIFYPKVEIIHEFAKGSYSNIKLSIHHVASAINYFNKWGWFFDNYRTASNLRCLEHLGYKK
jgi:GT2 family glycosyltransferase